MTCPKYTSAVPGECWCGRKLTGRKRTFCSVEHRKAVVNNHRWTQAKAAAKERVTYYRCEGCGHFVTKVEVNHKEPCKGKHGVWGCHHHQENLEVLCRPCHLAATAEQRKAGKL